MKQVAFGILTLATSGAAFAQTSDPSLRVDAFGWQPWADKVAVLREAVVGHDAAPSTPGASIDVERVADGAVVLSAPAVAWQGGAVHDASGDRVWLLDLGALTVDGEYRLVDPTTGAVSEAFAIGADVYAGVRHAAQRMFLYQRCGVAKAAPFAAAGWTDGACHVGPDQDTAARSVLDPSGGGLLDLSGGWHDAGDYNKYVNFTDDVIHDLLAAYALAPESWSDATNLPQSGNGRADLLDEVVVGLDWLLRMQRPDGSLLHKLGVTDFSGSSPPSTDAGPRRYAPATASATVSGAGAFAHGARVFSAQPDATSQAYAVTLQAAAESAWQWLDANPGASPSFYDNAGFVSAPAEDDTHWQTVNRLRAATHLLGLTGDTTYRDWFDANVGQSHLLQWGFALVYEQGLHAGLLAYAALPSATPSVADAIRAAYEGSVGGPFQLGNVLAGEDPYGAWLADQDIGWGSNRTRLQHGRLFADMVRFGLDSPRVAEYERAARAYLHSMHGLNPPGFTYLTNLHDLGAPRSVSETYHAWFAHGTDWDSSLTSLHGPAPGFLTGGPNPNFAPAAEYVGPPLEPPQGQPPLKAYRDWNTSWPENSWEVTECQLSYQSAYLALLASVARRPAWDDLGHGLGGAGGVARLRWQGPLAPGTSNALQLDGAPVGAFGLMLMGLDTLFVPFKGGTLVPAPLPVTPAFFADGAGGLLVPFVLGPLTPPGTQLYLQLALVDASAPVGVGLSNALRIEVRE